MNHFILTGSILFCAGATASAAPQGFTPPGLGAGIEAAPVVDVAHGGEAADAPVSAGRAIDLAICLDTSGSMDGLLSAAKQKIWAIVNDLALAEPLPLLRVALFSFGNDGDDPARGWVRRLVPLTEDLDLVSRELFALTTNGGTELVGRVVHSATTELDWTSGPGVLKLIVVAGNESADQDQQVRFGDACKSAIGRDIIVNAIYCGNPADELAPAWRDVARLADGQFAAIDQDHGTVTIATPFDDQLAALSGEINGTYLAYGVTGQAAAENQVAQDDNAAGLNPGAVAERAACKAGGLYWNGRWDLVDGCDAGIVDLATLPPEQLPEQMRAMSLEERREFVEGMAAERKAIQARVGELNVQRQAFLDAELRRQGLESDLAFDAAIRAAIRSQAGTCGFTFPAVEKPPTAGTEGAQATPATPAAPAPGAQQAAVPAQAGAAVNSCAPNAHPRAQQAQGGAAGTVPPLLQRLDVPPAAAPPEVPEPADATESAPPPAGSAEQATGAGATGP
ncbi:MAG: VWA domain-containing protein [Planctomycetota bacterium]|nr:VWA domain-containing protein [Planctomycetota bacterium]MDP6990184.1 VWA domain-containing protein [Planctomycetota bacterium]